MNNNIRIKYFTITLSWFDNHICMVVKFKILLNEMILDLMQLQTWFINHTDTFCVNGKVRKNQNSWIMSSGFINHVKGVAIFLELVSIHLNT